MIVELAGLPGSGKTTIVRRMVERDPVFSSTVVKPRARALLRGPRHAGPGFLPGPAWPAWLSLCARRAAQEAIVDPGPGTWVVLEEGIVHHLWRSRFIHPGLARRPWAGLLDATTPLVVLDSSQATRHARVSGKAHGGPVNRQLAGAAPGDATWQRAEQLMDEVLEMAGRTRRVVSVSTEGGLEEAVARVALAVMSAG